MVRWIASLFKGGPAGMNNPVMGYAPGPTFSQPAREAVYVTKQRKPFYSILGPGSPILHQPPGAAEPAYIMLAKTVQTFSAVGPGVGAGETMQQSLLIPSSGSLTEPSSKSI